jgi:hypothetical protein
VLPQKKQKHLNKTNNMASFLTNIESNVICRPFGQPMRLMPLSQLTLTLDSKKKGISKSELTIDCDIEALTALKAQVEIAFADLNTIINNNTGDVK